VPLVVGGIIPSDDAEELRRLGVAKVFTPKDYALTEIIDELVTVVREANGLA
jgi:ethylmalonyl-CoA mutase